MGHKWKKQIVRISLFLFGIIVLNLNTRGVSAAEKPAYTLTKGKKVTITNIINNNPLTSPDKKKYSSLTWKSGNKKIIKVIKNKKIKGLKKGSTYLRGYNSKKKKMLAIKVTVGKKVSGIKMDSTKVEFVLGDSARLNASVSPANASNKKMFYSSSDPAVATVSKTGKVTAVKEGSSVITITSKDGHAKKKIKVKVQANFTIMTSKGAVKGTWEPYSKSQALIWYGIPYGASTAGVNRWKAPQPVTPWSGILNVTIPKQQAAQYGDGTSYTGTEDCLYVNVTRPNSAAKNLPVMVYIHGGGNASGSSNVNFGNFAAATNCIVVTVEHRLGAFGYLSHPALRTGTAEENSGNFALLDIKAALTWVRDEIGNFGGDPGNVTLSGFSAGARNALLCMISPSMQGLFQKAIIFSGGCNTCTNEEGEKSAEDKLASILVKRGTYPDKKSAQKFLDAASDDVIRNLFDSLTTSEVANMYRSSSLRLANFPQAFNDGVVIPKDGFSVIRSGNYNRVPIILGSDATEFSSYAWSGNLALNVDDGSNAISPSQMLNLVANGVKYGSMLQSGHYIEKTANLLNQDMAHAPVYAYRFYWGTDAIVTDGFYSTYVGAFHGASKDFLRKSYKNNYTAYAPNALSETNKLGRQDLTSVMQKYVSNFLLTGNPNGELLSEWGTWNNIPGMNKIMIFNADQTKSISGMSSEYYDESNTFGQMRVTLTKEDYDVLVNSLFAGRFFMPETVPQY